MSPVPDRVRTQLANDVNAVRTATGVPALAAVLVHRDSGGIVGYAEGMRKATAGAGPQNQAQSDDRFCVGSLSKVLTGYLVMKLVQNGTLRWTMTIGDVFPELQDLAFALRHGVNSVHVGTTVETLMAHRSRLPYVPTNGLDWMVQWNDIVPIVPPELYAEYLHAANLRFRRLNYVVAAMQDAPVTTPVYGGGCIIVAAMAERLLDTTFEELIAREVFWPLGMTRSGFGRISSDADPPDGVWQHTYDAATLTTTPSAPHAAPPFDAHSHAPAGTGHLTAEDAGRFIAANLPNSGEPKIVVADALLVDGAVRVGGGSFVRSAWSVGGSGTTWYLQHNGDNNASFANMRVYPAANYGWCVMANVSSGGTANIGMQAVNAMGPLLDALEAAWPG